MDAPECSSSSEATISSPPSSAEEKRADLLVDIIVRIAMVTAINLTANILGYSGG